MTVELAASEYGDGEPVAILHGLFGAGRNWAGIARRLARQRRVIVFDLRNHGASPWAPTMTYAEMAADVRAAMRARGCERYALIGHSLGGKVAMSAALAAGAEVERVVAVDIAPAAYPVGYLAYVQAMRRLDPSTVARRADADARLAGAVPSPAERAFLLQNLILGDAPRWQLNLAAIEQALTALSDFPAPAAGRVFDGPTLFVAGAASDYLRPEQEAVARKFFSNARFVRISGAGHWVHAEQPEAFLGAVEGFLAG